MIYVIKVARNEFGWDATLTDDTGHRWTFNGEYQWSAIRGVRKARRKWNRKRGKYEPKQVAA